MARKVFERAVARQGAGAATRPYRWAIDEPEVFSLQGTALFRTGWTRDLTVLSAPCLVVKPGFDHFGSESLQPLPN